MNERIIYLPPPIAARLAEELQTGSGPAELKCEDGALHFATGAASRKLGAQVSMPARIEITDRATLADALLSGYPMRVYSDQVYTGPDVPGTEVGRACTYNVPSTEVHPGTAFHMEADRFVDYRSAGYLEMVCNGALFYGAGYGSGTRSWEVAPTWCRLSVEPIVAARSERLAFLLDRSVALPGLQRVGVWSGFSRKRGN